MRSFYSVAVIALAVAIGGCGTAPKRPAFNGSDQVQQFDAQAIVGTWNVTVLNALEGEQVSSVVYTYKSDGSWQASVKQVASGMEILAEGVGRWEVSGEQIIGTVDDVQVVSDNPLVKLMSGLMKTAVKKSSGSMNPYEISDSQMIWVTDDGQAMQLDRL